MAWSCVSTAASRPSEFAPVRRKVANRREQGRHTRTNHPAPSEKDLSMTAALSDPSLDQIFLSARTFNGWRSCCGGRKRARDLRSHEKGAHVRELQPRPFRLGAERRRKGNARRACGGTE